MDFFYPCRGKTFLLIAEWHCSAPNFGENTGRWSIENAPATI
jgi:hypothetical protein